MATMQVRHYGNFVFATQTHIFSSLKKSRRGGIFYIIIYAFGPAFTMFSGMEAYFLKFSLNFFASSLADAS